MAVGAALLTTVAATGLGNCFLAAGATFAGAAEGFAWDIPGCIAATDPLGRGGRFTVPRSGSALARGADGEAVGLAAEVGGVCTEGQAKPGLGADLGRGVMCGRGGMEAGGFFVGCG